MRERGFRQVASRLPSFYRLYIITLTTKRKGVDCVVVNHIYIYCKYNLYHKLYINNVYIEAYIYSRIYINNVFSYNFVYRKTFEILWTGKLTSKEILKFINNDRELLKGERLHTGDILWGIQGKY